MNPKPVDIAELAQKPAPAFDGPAMPPSWMQTGLNVLRSPRPTPRMLEGLKRPTNFMSALADTPAMSLESLPQNLTNEEMAALALQAATNR